MSVINKGNVYLKVLFAPQNLVPKRQMLAFGFAQGIHAQHSAQHHRSRISMPVINTRCPIPPPPLRFSRGRAHPAVLLRVRRPL